MPPGAPRPDASQRLNRGTADDAVPRVFAAARRAVARQAAAG